MKSRKASLHRIPFYIASMLFLALALGLSSEVLGGVDLEVPIEMLDRGISSPAGLPGTRQFFINSEVMLDDGDYDGDTEEYYFEIVASNANTSTGYSVYLHDATNGVDRTSYLVPANTQIKRFRTTTSFPRVSGNNKYLLVLDNTAVADQLKIFAARIIVVQTNATYTRIQIPLLNHAHDGFDNITDMGSDNVSSSTYSQEDEDRFTLWKKDLSVWGDIASGTPWSFEAVIKNEGGSTAYVSLFNKTDNAQVTATELSRSGSLQLQTVDFATNAASFGDGDGHEGDEFEVRHYQSRLARAALYVRLTNLTWGEVYWRFTRKQSQSSSVTHAYQRVLLNTSNYTNPVVYHEATGYETGSGVISTRVFDVGTSDSGTTGSPILNSAIEFNSTSRASYRNTTPLIDDVTSGNSYIHDIIETTEGSTISVASDWLVVTFSDTHFVWWNSPSPTSPYTSWDSAAHTIQAAINVASAGKNVIVRDGTYSECISMKNGVNVESENSEPTINCTTTLTATVTFENGPISCNLDDFNITHSSGTGAGIVLDGLLGTVTTTISECTIHDIADGGGIRMNGVVDCTITGNTIYDCGKGGISVGDVTTADDVQGGSSITIKNNTIGDNTDPYTEPNIEAGIYLKGSGSVTVDIGTVAEPNTICYNGEAGIRLDTITDLTIDSNTINNNTRAGILLIDVGSASGDAIVQNNDINNNTTAGINIGGASYLTIGGNNTINNNFAGVVFNMGDVVVSPGSASSGPVTITDNDINTNSYAGIGIIDAITNTVNINGQNDINNNTRAGIGIQNNCTLVITENTIRDNYRGGIHTGTDVADPGGFSGTAGSAVLTIKQNKVYGNGQSNYGGGIDVRHADGSIYNNLVYENHRGGIRFGDWIDEIINNTVADNGNATEDRGGGIIYDYINAGHGVNDQPAGTPPAALDIRNNICAYNEKAGIRACFDNTGLERDYNLLYSNNGTGATDCGWGTGVYVRNCVNMNYGGCGLTDSLPWTMLDPNDILAAPQFENRAGDDYRIQSSSPAVDAGDTSYGNDVSIPPGVGTLTIDMGAYGGPDGINWP
jgi:parallel beta-helix repeat protein